MARLAHGSAGAARTVTTVALVDDEPLFTAGLAMIIESQEDLEVIWQADSGTVALERQQRNPADVVLMDIQMPVLDGLGATAELIARGLPGRVMVLTTFDTDDHVLQAIETGASGFLLKNTPPDRLLDAIRAVASGDSVISPGPTRRLLHSLRRGPAHGSSLTPVRFLPSDRLGLEQMTPREREVLALVAAGLTNQEICDRLWLSMPTVKTHVGRLLSKTGSRDRVQLVLFALRTGVTGLGEILRGSS